MTEIYISENILEKDDLIRPQETNFRIYMYVCVCVFTLTFASTKVYIT